MSNRAEASTSASAASVPTTTVGTKRKAEDSPGHEALRSRLECSVCYNLMLPPIRQCPEGHNFCDRCATRLMTGTAPSSRKCPTCRIALSSPVARARNLEEWASEADIEVTCDFAACGMRFRYSACAEHQRTCLGRTVACPRRGCSWRGESSRLSHHLQHDDGCAKMAATPIPAKYSERHKDYSTTVIFETKRPVGDKRRWCPPRQLILVPANARLGTSPVRLGHRRTPAAPSHRCTCHHRARHHRACHHCLDPRALGQIVTAPCACACVLCGAVVCVCCGRAGGRARPCPQAAFCVALWKPRGGRQPFLAGIQLLRKPGNDEVPFSFDLSMSAYPRPPERMCVSRSSAVGTCAELDKTEVWRRPKLDKCRSSVLAADAASMAIFNTAGLSVNESGSVQRYELHVRLMPLIEPTDPEECAAPAPPRPRPRSALVSGSSLQRVPAHAAPPHGSGSV